MEKLLIVSFNEAENKLFEHIKSVLLETCEFDLVLEACGTVEDTGDLKINVREQTVFYRGGAIRLNHYEFCTLEYLGRHPNWIFTKEQIYEAVWKEAGENCGSAVANVISQIRRKLRQAGAEREYIQTIINQGYKFVAERNAEADS